MKGVLTLWANLEAARDDSSMNLSFGSGYIFVFHLHVKSYRQGWVTIVIDGMAPRA